MYSLTAKILHDQNPGHSSVVDSLQAKQATWGWLATVYVRMFMGNGFCVPGLINLLSKCDLFLSWGFARVPLAASQKPSPQWFIL